MSVIQGAVYTATYNAASALAGSTPVLTVTAPDQTVASPAVAVSGSTATANVTGAQVGQYLCVWSVTGVITDVIVDQFSVIAPALQLVSLSDVKQDLRLPSTDTTYDAQLRRWIAAANGVVTRICGPITPTTETYYIDGGSRTMVLPRRWVISITSLIETIAVVNYTLTEQPLGASVNNYGYTWERASNVIVRRGGAGYAIPFAAGMRSVQCTYVAGMQVIPEDIQLGALALVKHFYKKGNVPKSSPLQVQDPASQLLIGNYYVPNEVLELLSPYQLTPGIY